jgi:hypothetical protein
MLFSLFSILEEESVFVSYLPPPLVFFCVIVATKRAATTTFFFVFEKKEKATVAYCHCLLICV